ncbi:MAG: hypothetical protein AB7H80_07535 [Candidatus Kapaibacterium sp.]
MPDTSDAVEFFGIPDKKRMAEILRTIESAGGVRAAVEAGNELARQAVEQLYRQGGRAAGGIAQENEDNSGLNIVSPGWPYTLADNICYNITYLMWAGLDMLIDIQRVVVEQEFGGAKSFGAGSSGTFGSMTSALDVSNSPALQVVLKGIAFIFPLGLQAFSLPPAGPGSYYADYSATTTAQRTDFAFWLYKGLGILVNMIVTMAGSKMISSQTSNLFNSLVGNVVETLEEESEAAYEARVDIAGALSESNVESSIAQRFLPWVNSLFGGGWIIFTSVLGGMELAAMIEATIEFEDTKGEGSDDDNARVLLGLAWGDFFLKTMQNGIEGLSPLFKFLQTQIIVDASEGLSIPCLMVLDLTSDLGSAVLGGARSAIYLSSSLVAENS